MESGFISASRTATYDSTFHFSCNKSLYGRGGGRAERRLLVAGSLCVLRGSAVKGTFQKCGVLFGKNGLSGFHPLGPQGLASAIFFFLRTSRFIAEGGEQFSVPGSQWATATRLKGRGQNEGVQGRGEKIFWPQALGTEPLATALSISACHKSLSSRERPQRPEREDKTWGPGCKKNKSANRKPPPSRDLRPKFSFFEQKTVIG
jgi:hypothetical protein